MTWLNQLINVCCSFTPAPILRIPLLVLSHIYYVLTPLHRMCTILLLPLSLLYSTPFHTRLHLKPSHTYIIDSLPSPFLPFLPSLLPSTTPSSIQFTYSPLALERSDKLLATSFYTSVHLCGTFFPSPSGARWFFSYIDSVQASWGGISGQTGIWRLCCCCCVCS